MVVSAATAHVFGLRFRFEAAGVGPLFNFTEQCVCSLKKKKSIFVLESSSSPSAIAVHLQNWDKSDLQVSLAMGPTNQWLC